MTNSAQLLSVKNLSKNFGGLKALEDVSFDVKAGEIVGIMGANGAGKTTLFACIAGHEAPSAGEIIFEGTSLAGLRPDQVCHRGVGRTFQIVKPFNGMSVLENVALAARFGTDRLATAPAEARARALLDELDMAGLATQMAGALTLAGKKRLELARAVATGAKLVMLDEVMAGLNPSEVAQMLAAVRQLHKSRGLTVLVIEHVMRALMDLSDRIVVLHHGRLIAQGTPQEVGENSAVQSAYFGEVAEVDAGPEGSVLADGVEAQS